MRARRQERQNMAQQVVAGLLQTAPIAAPEGLQTFPGFEPGGLFDTLMGVVTGKGANAAVNVPQALREPGRINIPISSMQQEVPPLSEDFGGALGMAQQILDAMRLPQTGASQQASAGGGTSGQVVQPDAGGGLSTQDLLAFSLISQLLGGQTPSGTANPLGNLPQTFSIDQLIEQGFGGT
jgi:hypothetical protein